MINKYIGKIMTLKEAREILADYFFFFVDYDEENQKGEIGGVFEDRVGMSNYLYYEGREFPRGHKDFWGKNLLTKGGNYRRVTIKEVSSDYWD